MTNTAQEDGLIAQFWSWWGEEGKARALVVFDAEDETEELEEEASELAEAIAEHLDLLGLSYETYPGTSSRHLLVLSPDEPSLEELADRWLAAAPPADDAFAYDNRRPALPNPAEVEVSFGDHTFRLSDSRVTAERGDHKVHVHVMNDSFAEAPEEVSREVARFFLDALLGEREVERRIGAVTYGADHRHGHRDHEEFALVDLPAYVAEG